MDINFPKDLKITHKSTGSIISISSIIGIILSFFSYFNFDKLDLPIKIIIILSIFLFISIVDIIILYIRDREIIYKISMVEFIQNSHKEYFDENIKLMKSKHNSLQEEIKQIESELKTNSKN